MYRVQLSRECDAIRDERKLFVARHDIVVDGPRCDETEFETASLMFVLGSFVVLFHESAADHLQ
jgi:hypothetical protein